MALPQEKVKIRYNEEEYLAFEREAEEVRHEYLDGEIRAMSGESLEHGYISTNIVSELHLQLKGKPCGVLTKDMKVRSGAVPSDTKDKRKTKGLYSYPDVLVVCDEPQFHDSYRDVILNPTVIIEVLSKSTETFDTTIKFVRYVNWNPSLTDYILVVQTFPTVSHYTQNEKGEWVCRIINGLDASFRIESIDCVLRLADIYDRVKFPENEEESVETETQEVTEK